MPPKSTAKKSWTTDHQNAYNWLYNHYKTIDPDANKDKFIDKNKKYLMSIIENNYHWGDSSKEKLLFMISRYLHNKESWRYSKLYQEKGIEYIKTTTEKENKNQLDDNEKINFREHNYFVDILKKIDYTTITDKVLHFKYLLLACLTYQPTLRTSFYTTAKFIRLEKDNDKKNNFVHISKQGKLKVRFIVNNDKVSKTKSYAMDKNLNFINVIDEKLVKIINDSFEKYPRTYLFENNNKSISSQMLLKWLRDITVLSGVNVDMMRSSYITWYYANHTTYGDRIELSKMMRHSVTTAEKNYNKVFENKINQNNVIVDNDKCDEIKQNLYKSQKENDDLKLILNTYTNQTENTNDLKHYKKKRSDIIYNLNKKGREPREDTLKKYNITFDKLTNAYI